MTFAQTAEVTGRVTDPSGAGVPGAGVTVTNTDTGISRKTPSNHEGFYTVSLLQPGAYRADVEKPGFQPVMREDILLQVNQVLRPDFPLQVGAVKQAL
jgi:hypothetical protein